MKFEKRKPHLPTIYTRIRELELQVAYLRGYSGIKQIDFENACERYGMGKPVTEGD